MNNGDRIRLDLLACEFLEAIEADDFDKLQSMWKYAETHPECVPVFEQVYEDLYEEQLAAEQNAATKLITDMVTANMPSAEIMADATEPLTIAQVAAELQRHPPTRWTPEALSMQQKLLASTEPLPEQLALPKLLAWAQALYGSAPVEFWRAFRENALRLKMRQHTELEIRMAARKPKKPGEST